MWIAIIVVVLLVIGPAFVINPYELDRPKINTLSKRERKEIQNGSQRPTNTKST